MALLEVVPGVNLKQGCPVNPTNATRGCMGPEGMYWTVFGTEARFLELHAAAAVLAGLLLVGLLEFLDRRERIRLHLIWKLAAGAIVVPAVFLVLAYFFPVQVVY